MSSKRKATISVARESYPGVCALGRYFANGQHELELSDEELAALEVRKSQGLSVFVHPEPKAEAAPKSEESKAPAKK